MRKHIALSILTLFLLTLSACGALSEQTAPQTVTEPPADTSRDAGGSAGEAADTLQSTTDRVIIYRANMTLRVQEMRAAVDQIETIAQKYDGFVAEATIEGSEDDSRFGSITIRVDATRFEEALDDLRAVGERVISEHRESEDVTEEYVDLEAQLENLQRVEEELQALLTEVRENRQSAEDILAVYRELADVRTEIERIQGRLQYLDSLSSMATITISLRTEAAIVDESWQPAGVVQDALRTLVRGLQLLFSAAVWVVIVVLPILVILLVPAVVLVWVIRRWMARRQKATTDS